MTPTGWVGWPGGTRNFEVTGNLKPTDVMGLGDGMHSDGEYLWLRVRGSARSWIVRGPRDERGKKRDAGLGSVDRVSLALARKERDRLIEAWRNGKDPIAERKAAREAAANRKTFAEVAAMKIDQKQTGWRTSAEGRASSLSSWTRNIERDCAPIAAMAIDEISVDNIKRVVSPYWDRGNHKAGKDCLKRVEAVFNFAIAHGWRTAANPAAWSVFKEIWPEHDQTVTHRAALPWSEAPEFIDQLRASDALAARVIEFAVLTATRSLETRGARWSEIDWNARTWTIPALRMKMGKKRPEAHVVPLSAQAIALLERVRAEGVAGELVFPGYVNDGSRSERDDLPVPNASVWKLVKRLAGDRDATTHGFRSTFCDWCRDRRVDADVRELCLAHKVGPAVVEAYARDRLVSLRRPVMQAWADFLDGVAETNVVPFRAVA